MACFGTQVGPSTTTTSAQLSESSRIVQLRLQLRTDNPDSTWAVFRSDDSDGEDEKQKYNQAGMPLSEFDAKIDAESNGMPNKKAVYLSSVLKTSKTHWKAVRKEKDGDKHRNWED